VSAVSTIDPVVLERLVVGGPLAVAAVAIAFGPELRALIVRLRSRSALRPSADVALQAESAS
jgi:hypothetical protein